MKIPSNGSFHQSPPVAATDMRQLLITQMRNQNPMEPMKEQELFSQLAQVAALEQGDVLIQNAMDVKQSLQRLEQQSPIYVSMIGREVTWMDEIGFQHRGIIEAIQLKEHLAHARIGGQLISFGSITQVK